MTKASFRITIRVLFLLTAGLTLFVNYANAQVGRSETAGQLVATRTEIAPRRTAEELDSSAGVRSVVSSGAAVNSLADPTPIERRAFEMINSIRVKKGLAALMWDSELCGVARDYSKNMARGNFFSHVSPEGSTPKDRVQQAGLKAFRSLGENIAYNQGYDDPGAFAVERWMISPGHRENILSREFDASAIGVFVNSDGSVYLTQLFIMR